MCCKWKHHKVNIVYEIPLQKFAKYYIANDTLEEKTTMKCNSFTFQLDDVTWRKINLGVEYIRVALEWKTYFPLGLKNFM